MTNPTALAAPVDDGIILAAAALPALQSFPPLAGPSTTNYVAVEAWTVVIRPIKIFTDFFTFNNSKIIIDNFS